MSKNDILLNTIDEDDEMKIVQIFVKSDGVNSGAIFGSIKIEKEHL